MCSTIPKSALAIAGKFLLVGLGLMLLASCRKSDPMQRTQSVEAFHTLQLNSDFEVELMQDSLYAVEVFSDADYIDALHIEVRDSILRISNEGKARWRKPSKSKVRLRVHAHGLRLVEANEACFVRTVNPIESHEFGLITRGKLNQADLELNNTVFYTWNAHPCGGKIRLRGTTDQLKIWNVAIMAVDASACIARYALVENLSKADVSVQVTEYLEYRLKGSGSIYLKGNPALNEAEHSGSGQFIQSP
jgi:hypothetical protein